MPIQHIGQRVLGMAIVLEDAHGTRTLIGVNDVSSWRWECDLLGAPGPWLEPFGPPSFRMEVEASAGFVRSAAPAGSLPKGLPRGIYLPDLSFHALPAPEDGDV